MRDRIKKIIELESISYSKFADIIGIQRSGISHILSGRNNPSLEVVQKILESFDYLNTDWLLFGKGEMKKYDKQANLFDEIPDNQVFINDRENIEKIKSKSGEKSKKDKEDDHLFHSPEVKINSKNIERIVIFFKNNKFKEYQPD